VGGGGGYPVGVSVSSPAIVIQLAVLIYCVLHRDMGMQVAVLFYGCSVLPPQPTPHCESWSEVIQ